MVRPIISCCHGPMKAALVHMYYFSSLTCKLSLLFSEIPPSLLTFTPFSPFPSIIPISPTLMLLRPLHSSSLRIALLSLMLHPFQSYSTTSISSFSIMFLSSMVLSVGRTMVLQLEQSWAWPLPPSTLPTLNRPVFTHYPSSLSYTNLSSAI